MNTNCTVINKPENNQKLKPKYTFSKNKTEIHLEIELPGVPKENTEISIHGKEVWISGRRSPMPDQKWNPIWKEMNDTDYFLHLKLQESVNENEIHAKSQNGVLKVRLPFKEETKAKKIEIK